MEQKAKTKKTGNEQVKVSTRVDKGKTTVEISVYAQAGQTTRKGKAVVAHSEAAS